MGERARWEQSKILQGALSEETPSWTPIHIPN
jgi:hypothetical protein